MIYISGQPYSVEFFSSDIGQEGCFAPKIPAQADEIPGKAHKILPSTHPVDSNMVYFVDY
jgi:hypothetical protein